MKYTFMFSLTISCLVFSFCRAEQVNNQKTIDLNARPNVYWDCDCFDDSHIRREIPYVNYVRDRHQADVYLMVTRQRTGSRGIEYTLTFIGQNRFAGISDTLIYNSRSFDTEEIERAGFINTMRRGLIPYLNRTPLGELFEIVYKGKTDNLDQQQDYWNHWVFRIGLDGNLQGEKQQERYHLRGWLRADRITRLWKIRSSVWAGYEEDNYDFEDDKFSSFSRRASTNLEVVRAISDHFSVGLFSRLSSSTYENEKRRFRFTPALEYNLFPYRESTYHDFRISYSMGYEYFYYYELTLYNKLKERILRHKIDINFDLIKTWGRIELDGDYSSHLSDLDFNRFSLSGQLSLNLFEGFSVELKSGYASIHDQVSIPKRDVDLEELLLQRRELETQYSFWGAVGFSYTFGSIYNNIVNSRFGN